MSRYLVTLHSTIDRLRAVQIVNAAPLGSRIEVKAAKRSVPQNDRMWAMLTEIARQLPWHSQTLRPDDWKLLFLDALKRELRNVPNLSGTGLVNINQSSSDLTKSEMSDLIELMFQFGAERGVKFAEDVRAV